MRSPLCALSALLCLVSNVPRDVAPLQPMRIARASHTATALTNGQVLVAGGFTGDRHAAESAELYDPIADRFVALPRMRIPRHSHTATRLPDGRVLIAGGYGPAGEPIADAELYDPTSRTFTAVGGMRAARSGHTAVLLADGTVLLAGGVGPNWQFLASAERFNPATATFAPTGDMHVARESHVAVLLADGRVLVIGGHTGRRELMTLHASTEVYDPGSGRFRVSGTMHTARHKHDALRLADGTVLVTGGADRRDDRGEFRSTERFDPRTERFTDGPLLALTRYKHQGTSLLLPSGRVLLAGGAPKAEELDVRTGQSRVIAGDASLAGQFSAAALLPDGGALITGGYGNGTGPRASAWRFSP